MTLSIGARVVLVAAAVWQFVSWVGRISLLTDAESVDPWNWFRIGGSLLVGALILLVGVGLVRRRGVATAIAWAYLLVGLVTWSRSLFNVWTEPNTLGFRLVHTALALVTWGFGIAAVRITAVAPTPVDQSPAPTGR